MQELTAWRQCARTEVSPCRRFRVVEFSADLLALARRTAFIPESHEPDYPQSTKGDHPVSRSAMRQKRVMVHAIYSDRSLNAHQTET
jgi:hypothetical protein